MAIAKTSFGLIIKTVDEQQEQHVVINKNGMFCIYGTLDSTDDGNIFLRFSTDEMAKKVAAFLSTSFFNDTIVEVKEFKEAFDKTLIGKNNKIAYIPTNYEDTKLVSNLVKNYFDTYRKSYNEKIHALKEEYVTLMRNTTLFGRLISSFNRMR